MSVFFTLRCITLLSCQEQGTKVCSLITCTKYQVAAIFRPDILLNLRGSGTCFLRFHNSNPFQYQIPVDRKNRTVLLRDFQNLRYETLATSDYEYAV